MWQQFLAVALGGALGSSLRFAIARALPATAQTIPWATVIVNLVGCLLIGVAIGWGTARGGLSTHVRALAVAGFLGGFTTFSAFGLETVVLAREGGPGLSAAYLLLQVGGGVLAVVLGLWLGRASW